MLLGRLARHTIVYGLSSLIGRFLNYLLVPFYTFVLHSPAQYGTLSECYSYVALLGLVFIYGLETAYFRLATDPHNNEKHIFQSVYSLLTLSTPCLALLCYGLGTQLNTLAGADEPAHALVILLVAILALDTWCAPAFARLRLQAKALKFAILKLSAIVINITLNVCFLWIAPRLHETAPPDAFIRLYFDPNTPVYYILLANLIANALWIPALVHHWRQLRWRWNPKLTRKLLSYGIPLMGVGLAAIAIEALPRVMYKYLAPAPTLSQNLYALGQFSAAAKLAVFMLLLIQSYRYAAEPIFFASKSKTLIAQATQYLLTCTAWVFVILSLYLNTIAPFFLRQPQYLNALHIVPVLLLAYLVLGMYFNVSMWYKLTDNTLKGFHIALIGLSIALLCNLCAVPIWGYAAIAYSTLTAYAAMLLTSHQWGRKFQVQYPYKRMTIILFASIAIVAANQYLSPLSLPKVSLIAILYTIGLILTERKSFASLYASLSNKKT